MVWFDLDWLGLIFSTSYFDTTLHYTICMYAYQISHVVWHVCLTHHHTIMQHDSVFTVDPLHYCHLVYNHSFQVSYISYFILSMSSCSVIYCSLFFIFSYFTLYTYTAPVNILSPASKLLSSKTISHSRFRQS